MQPTARLQPAIAQSSARREQAYQRHRIELLSRLLAALLFVPKPRPHAAHRRAARLELERAGAPVPVGSAGAPALGREAGLGQFTSTS